MAILFIALSIFIYAHLLPEKTRDPETSRPAQKENLPRNTQDRPEFVDFATGNKDKLVKEPDEQLIPPVRAKVKMTGNWDRKRYHLPRKKYYHKVLFYHRVEFDSEQQAI